MDICSICHESLSSDTSDTYYECDHAAHLECSKQWDETRVEQCLSPSCPVCRANSKQKVCVTLTTENASLYACLISGKQLIVRNINGFDEEIRLTASSMFGESNCDFYNEGNLIRITIPTNLEKLVLFLVLLFNNDAVHVSTFTFSRSIDNVAGIDLDLNKQAHKTIVWFMLLSLMETFDYYDQINEWTKFHQYILTLMADESFEINSLDGKPRHVFWRIQSLFTTDIGLVNDVYGLYSMS